MKSGGADEGVTVGADVGGSKAHLVICTGGSPSREVTVPSAHWYQEGLAQVGAGLATALTDAERAHARAMVVGAHGCDTRQQCQRLEVALGRALGIPVVALNDAELVLPAAGVGPGAGLISGTGSIAIGYGHDGALIAVGGWGGYLGDEGSGTGLFRDAARAATEAYDRMERDDPLIKSLVDLLELDDLRDLPGRLATGVPPTAWSSLVPALFVPSLEQGSALARHVVDNSADALASLIVLLGRRGANIDEVVAAGGVVANAGWMRAALDRAFSRLCPQSRLRYLDKAPVWGAVALAEELRAAMAGQFPAHGLHPRLAETAPVWSGG